MVPEEEEEEEAPGPAQAQLFETEPATSSHLKSTCALPHPETHSAWRRLHVGVSDAAWAARAHMARRRSTQVRVGGDIVS